MIFNYFFSQIWWNHTTYVNKEVICITPVLAKLHWLPVKSRISLTLGTLVCNIPSLARPHIWRRSLPTTNRLRRSCYWRLLDPGSRLHTEHSVTQQSRFGTLFRWLWGNAETLELSKNSWKHTFIMSPTKLPKLIPHAYERLVYIWRVISSTYLLVYFHNRNNALYSCGHYFTNLGHDAVTTQ